jgi:glycosidase
MFGTLADAEQLIADAHRHGIRIIPDIVPNHTSNQHAWFQAALAVGPGSPERERYIFRPGRGPDGAEPPNNWVSCFGGPAWTRLPDGEWYLHLYAPEQPDLNWQHPDVHAEFESILRFWFSRGVDGFRIDVAHGLAKDPELPNLPPKSAGGASEEHIQHPHWDRDEVHDIYRTWRKIADGFDGDRAFVAEAWADTPDRLAAYVRPGGLHTAFNFDFLMASWDAKDLRTVVDDSLAMLNGVGAPATWVLSNHDVMRRTSRYARQTVARWVPNQRYQPQGPVDLDLGIRRARAAALLMLALPGGAYIYQGDELGLPEVEDLGRVGLGPWMTAHRQGTPPPGRAVRSVRAPAWSRRTPSCWRDWRRGTRSWRLPGRPTASRPGPEPEGSRAPLGAGRPGRPASSRGSPWLRKARSGGAPPASTAAPRRPMRPRPILRTPSDSKYLASHIFAVRLIMCPAT